MVKNVVPQIFGIGGKFYVEPWESRILQRHLLSLVDKPNPRICYLGGAVGDNPNDTEIFYRTMNHHGARVTHLNIFEPHTADFISYFLQHDIIYVNGGSTRNLLTIWKDWGIDEALREAWQAGVVLSGTSAGSICWFEGCITDSLPEKMAPLRCLGFLKGSGCTHYNMRPDRPEAFRRCLQSGEIASPGIALDDCVAVHYKGTEVFEIVSAFPGAGAYLLTRNREAQIVEATLDVRSL